MQVWVVQGRLAGPGQGGWIWCMLVGPVPPTVGRSAYGSTLPFVLIHPPQPPMLPYLGQPYLPGPGKDLCWPLWVLQHVCDTFELAQETCPSQSEWGLCSESDFKNSIVLIAKLRRLAIQRCQQAATGEYTILGYTRWIGTIAPLFPARIPTHMHCPVSSAP